MDFKKLIILLLPIFIFAKEPFQEPWGKDTILLQKKAHQSIPQKKTVGRKIANGVIHFYQKNISPANGPKSNFRPTSSKYMELAIQRYGFVKGFVMGCDRLMRENSDPWVYRTIDVNGCTYKFDPALEDKKLRSN
ncbi:MAG: membrane protein insertion efficiency factor YidD [Chlamydiota bacterium]|jgi:putative component of membrane protein insertase Oxa1/YidC/SpoIIIJ protein YidD